jgi:hypothetical protein
VNVGDRELEKPMKPAVRPKCLLRVRWMPCLVTAAILPSLACLLGLWATANAAGEHVPVYQPQLVVLRAAGPSEVDGRLEDAGWRGAARASNFAEHNPGDQTKPDVDTEVWITHDDDNLYVAWLCYHTPIEIRASFCERDQIFSDDYVILCLDPSGDATLAYEISTNPYGVPGDLLFSSSNGEDITYDMIYETAVTRTAGPVNGEPSTAFPASSRGQGSSCCRPWSVINPALWATTAGSPMAISRATSEWASLAISPLS